MQPPEYTADDYRSGTPPRYFGSETEYTMQLPYSLSEYWNASASLMPDSITLAYGTEDDSIVTPNGGFLYIDNGETPEVATPECSTPDELALHERVGEQYMIALGAHAARLFQTSPTVYKRSGHISIADRHGNTLFSDSSVGHHENYSIPPYVTLVPHAWQSLQSLLVTRRAWTGAGMVTQTGYSTSQKPSAINYVSGTSYNNHGAKMPWRRQDGRLEIRDGEGHMSEWTIRHKYALTSLALRLIEHNAFPQNLYIQPEYIGATVQSIAHDPTAPITLQDGSCMTPMEHQHAIYTSAMERLQHYQLPEYETESYYSFTRLHDAFQEISTQDEYVTPISDRIDWAAKLEHMYLNGLDNTNINGFSFRALEYDLKWEDLDENGPARRWYQKYGNERMSSKDVASHANLPPNTRAKARVSLLLNNQPTATYAGKTWDSLIINGYRIDMPNPGDTSYKV